MDGIEAARPWFSAANKGARLGGDATTGRDIMTWITGADKSFSLVGARACVWKKSLLTQDVRVPERWRGVN